jgi:hypothetical protein
MADAPDAGVVWGAAARAPSSSSRPAVVEAPCPSFAHVDPPAQFCLVGSLNLGILAKAILDTFV